MEKIQNESLLIIKFTDDESDWGYGPEKKFRASNIVFEGGWLVFFDINAQKTKAIPADLLDEVITK